ncbi:hypothetical protein DEO72_LG3g2217 [Vigna unguiculata]|uniref:Putative plant transposon protein domain-containing protein n=1 Tax=Vigna unguiculata TaxID=3917 RepID=A0A4D6LGN8_VIGUN|nr:hypothetical protein DEO72_LG3g2217 [Vigna unguiculata]
MDEDAEFEYDQHKFTSKAAARRFLEIMHVSILSERHVNLKVGEFDDFRLELERRKWHRVLGNLPNEVDEVLVKEFYANAYNSDGSLPCQAKVWGKMIKFNRKALNTFLRTPIFPADRNTPYGDFLIEDKDLEAIVARLCILGESYVIGVSRTPVRILRKHLNSLAHIWSVFSYNNISPNTHTSDINLERSYLIFAIMTKIENDIGVVISQEIALIASNATKLGFPALITALCKAKGVVSNTPIFLRLQSPINSRFISKHCINPAVDHVPAPRPVPRPRPPNVPRASSSEATSQAAMSKMFARQEDIWDSKQAVRRGTRCLMDNLHKLSLAVPNTPDDYLMTGAQFDECISWPRGRPKSQWGGVEEVPPDDDA